MCSRFSVTKNMVLVLGDDFTISGKYADQTVSDHCHARVSLLNNHYSGTALHGSYLNGTIKVGWPDSSAFASAYLDAVLKLSGDVRIRLGQRIFGHCPQIARDTLNLKLHAHGQNLIAASLDLQNLKIAKVNGTWSIVFNLKFSLKDTSLQWKMDDVNVQHGCTLKVLGIKILSVCGWVERKVREKANELMNKISNVYAPNLVHRIEAAFQSKIGDTVVIPLTWDMDDEGVIEQCLLTLDKQFAGISKFKKQRNENVIIEIIK